MALKPCMTAKEWGRVTVTKDGTALGWPEDYELPEGVSGAFEIQIRRDQYGEGNRKLAALCLHEQPFGFTQSDVTAIRDVVRVEGPENYRALVDLADRIESLLPPR